MALDRRITIRIEQPGRRAGPDETEIDPDTGNPYRLGEYIPGPTIDYPVWAERRSAGSNDKPPRAGFSRLAHKITISGGSRSWRLQISHLLTC